MPRATTKKGKSPKPPKESPDSNGAPLDSGAVATAVEEPPPPPVVETRRPTPPPPVDIPEPPPPKAPQPPADKDRIATSLNIAKLQAMSMVDLNQMAREFGVENFGTMRKHEIIFHILQKNAERAGVLFSEGVLEVLTEGFGFLR